MTGVLPVLVSPSGGDSTQSTARSSPAVCFYRTPLLPLQPDCVALETPLSSGRPGKPAGGLSSHGPDMGLRHGLARKVGIV